MESILKGIVDDKTLRMLETLVSHDTSLYHLNKISKDSRVPIATASRIMKVLVEQDIAETISVGKIRLYRLRKNNKTQTLGRLIGGGVVKSRTPP